MRPEKEQVGRTEENQRDQPLQPWEDGAKGQGVTQRTSERCPGKPSPPMQPGWGISVRLELAARPDEPPITFRAQTSLGQMERLCPD